MSRVERRPLALEKRQSLRHIFRTQAQGENAIPIRRGDKKQNRADLFAHRAEMKIFQHADHRRGFALDVGHRDHLAERIAPRKLLGRFFVDDERRRGVGGMIFGKIPAHRQFHLKRLNKIVIHDENARRRNVVARDAFGFIRNAEITAARQIRREIV